MDSETIFSGNKPVGEDEQPTFCNGCQHQSKNDCHEKDLDDVLSSFKFGLFNYKMLLLSGSAYFAICAQMMVIVFLSKPIKDLWGIDHYTYAWLPILIRIGSIIGCFIFGTLSDHYGRKYPYLVALVFTAVFSIVSAFSSSFIFLIIIRCLVAVGTGGIEATNFVLMLEFLPKRNRGAVMVAITFFGAMGAILCGGLAWWILPIYGWHTLLGACAAPSIVVCGLTLLLGEESPRYLFVSGQKATGMKLLKKIAAWNKVQFEDVDVTVTLSEERGRILDLFNREHLRQSAFIIPVWFLQATGYWGVTVYLPEYMTSLGVDGYFNMFMVFIGELPGLCLAMIFVEKHMLGRIKSLRVFSLGTCLSLALFSAINIDFMRAVFVIVCYFFMVPIYSLLNTYTPEIYPTNMRGIAMATVNAIIEVPGLITPFVGATLLSHSTRWLYPVVWSAVFFLQFCITFGLKLETAGENLRDSDLKKKININSDRSQEESLVTSL